MNPILAQFNNEPALIEPSKQAVFESCVKQTAAFLETLEAKGHQELAAGCFWFADDDWRKAYRPYSVTNGVLSIPVQGVLLNKFPWAAGYATGYEYIYQAMKRGMEDEEVKGIALLIDSPGGMVSGNFDLVDRMFAMRGAKPVKAFAADSAYSAAYSIASAADLISVSRSGGVGSIGVVTLHVDYSNMLAEAGIKVTFIFAGKHKVDGNAYEPLPEDVRKKIQGRIDALYSDFVSIVARNRDMDEKAVRDTEAETFMASEAIANGLADEAGTFEDAFAAFTANVNSNEEDSAMAENPKAITEEALAAAVEAAKATATAEGEASGYTAAMTRINGIIGSDAAKTRPTAALNAALKTSMKVEEATAFLATLPEEGKPEAKAQGAGAPEGMFKDAMDKSKNPGVDADGGDDDQDETQAKVNARSALIRGAGIPGFKSKE